MRKINEGEDLDSYTREMVEEAINSESYFIVIAKTEQIREDMSIIEHHYVWKNFPEIELHKVLINTSAQIVANLIKKSEVPVNVVINENKE